MKCFREYWPSTREVQGILAIDQGNIGNIGHRLGKFREVCQTSQLRRPLATQLVLIWLCEVRDVRAHGNIGDLPSQGRLIMSRLADYLAIVGYDHKKDRKYLQIGCYGMWTRVGQVCVACCWDGRRVEGWARACKGLSGRRAAGPVNWLTLGHACPHHPQCHAFTYHTPSVYPQPKAGQA